MLDFINVKIIATVQIIVVIGIIHFWIKWFRVEHNDPWLPKGYLEHERSFVYPDTVMSILMLISAILLFMENPLGERLALVCGGMMLFLTTIDIAYLAQNDLFAKNRGGKENWAMVIPITIMSTLLILRFI